MAPARTSGSVDRDEDRQERASPHVNTDETPQHYLWREHRSGFWRHLSARCSMRPGRDICPTSSQEHRMPWMSRTIAGLGFGVIAAAIPYLATATTEAAQPPQSAQPPRVDARFSLTAEPFCSEVKVRTSSARLHWSAPAAALAANGLTTLAAARQTLEATIYKNGFEQGLLVAVPIGPATADRPVLPQ